MRTSARYAAAWDSDSVNAQTGNFFRATRATIDQAFLRPRVAGHRKFQPAAGELIHDFVWNGSGSVTACLAAFDQLSDSLLADWQPGHDA